MVQLNLEWVAGLSLEVGCLWVQWVDVGSWEPRPKWWEPLVVDKDRDIQKPQLQPQQPHSQLHKNEQDSSLQLQATRSDHSDQKTRLWSH